MSVVKSTLLRIIAPDEITVRRGAVVDSETINEARRIVENVRARGETALREYAEQFHEIAPGDSMVKDHDALATALAKLGTDEREVLERTADRIRTFAQAQRNSLSDVRIRIAGGEASHRVAPVEIAGCYAPGGRYALPSSVLMAAITARVAGVETVWVASPKPTAITLAAAAIADADGLLAAGGAHAIAALAFGAGPVPACDVIAGPGNRWVTAAKHIISAHVRIDMLAGPSELVILADGDADPALIAADLLAQAEHDVDALPVLIATDEGLILRVDHALREQLADLPTADTAQAALGNGFAVCVTDLDEAIEICDRIAPEHLHLHLSRADEVAPRLKHYGALFIGAQSAEVLGDYGAGPNHTLPTGGTARSDGGLSILHFLRLQTSLRIDDREKSSELIDDAIALARMEGLEAHARAAERRRS